MRQTRWLSWRSLLVLSVALLSLWSVDNVGQEVDFGSVQFVPNSVDPSSDVTVSGGVGAVFANQQVKFEFAFVRGIATKISISVIAIPVGDGQNLVRLNPTDTGPQGIALLSCETGVPGNTTLNAAASCADLALDTSIDKTLIRIGFNASSLTGNTGEFDLFAEIDVDGDTRQTADSLLRLQISGKIAVDLAIEGPVSVTPPAPRQGDRITVRFLITNRDFQNAGFINSLDFSLRVPGLSTFTPTTFLELNCTIGGQACAGLPLAIEPLERKAVEIQFVSSQLAPTQPGESYLLRIRVNEASRAQEGGNEVARSNNIFNVNFSVGLPQRNLIVTLLGGPQRLVVGEEAAFELAVTNQTPLPLSHNKLLLSLEADAASPQGDPAVAAQVAAAIKGVSFDCGPQAAAGSALTASCDDFSLFTAETRRFVVRFSTLGLVPDVNYRWVVQAAGPEAQASAADALDANLPGGEFSRKVATFFVAKGTGTGGPTSPVTPQPLSPELRPVSLQIVPSATVEVGTTLVLFSTIKNAGNRDAENVLVTFSLTREDDNAASPIEFVQFFPRLGVGLTLSVRQAFETKTLAAGRYRVRVEVRLQDPQATELDPRNNALEAFVDVVEPQQ